MEKGFGFDVPGRSRLPNFGKDFFRRLHKTLCPARLLGFEAVHVHGKLGSAFDLREVEKLPALELRAIGKIRVFSERVVLPAASVVNGFAAPHAGRAIEVEESAAARTGAMLDDKVTVEKNGFDVGEQGIVAVEVCPPSLHHANVAATVGVHEIGNGAA